MPLEIQGNGLNILVPTRPLTQSEFAPFGDVISNPRPDVLPPSASADAASQAGKTILSDDIKLPYDAIVANQGSAVKYQHPTRPVDLYSDASSRVPSKAVVSMFVCSPKGLDNKHPFTASSPAGQYMQVKVLERHPFTTQTFVPVAARPGAKYLIIVAPSLPSTPEDNSASLPYPSHYPTHRAPPAQGLPDVTKIQAFTADASQAITYAAGTWHAPMVTLCDAGETIDFFVAQFSNGVGEEDCQEVYFKGEKGGVVISVEENLQAKL